MMPKVVQQLGISIVTGKIRALRYAVCTMEKYNEVVGVDVVANKYLLCILDEKGKHPKYYRGRVDTKGGQAGFFARIPAGAIIAMPSGELAVLAVRTLGVERVVVLDEDETYALWEKAGVERGTKMARFAALALFENRTKSKTLDEKEQKQLLQMQQAELDAIMKVGSASQQISMDILRGSTDAKLFAKAVKNEQESRRDPVIGETVKKKTEEVGPVTSDDTSFFARLYRTLKELE